MRDRRLGKGGLMLFAIAVVAGAVVAAPAASARSDAGVSLSVLPLRASALGSAARGLPLELSSGVIRNANPYAHTLPLFPNRFSGPVGWPWPSSPRLAELGRVTGYALDYGHGDGGGAGITEVWTSVDAYKTSADAAEGLAFWRGFEIPRGLETNLFSFNPNPLSATATKEKAAAVGTGRFAVLIAYSAANLSPLFGLDEQFTVGRYEADVTVWGGSAAAAEKLAPRLAKKLDARIKQALAGRLWAKPVKLPPKAGADLGSPDLAPLGLQTTDLNGQASATFRGYRSEPGFPFHFYAVSMAPAGQFQSIEQKIVWYPTANAARFNDDLERDWWGWGSWGGFRLLDLSGVGDGAWAVGEVFTQPPGALLRFLSGRLGEFVGLGDVRRDIQVSEAEDIAGNVATHINAAGYGN